MNKCSKLPLVSIVVLVKGRPQFLHQCFNSILNQSYSNIEVIIIYSKCPKDLLEESLNICNYYCSIDRRFKCIHSNKGVNSSYKNVVDCIKLGFDNCNGKYLSIVDSDDYINVDCIKYCIENIGNKGLIYTYCQQFGNVNKLDTRALYTYSKENLLNFFMVFHFRMFLKSAYEKIDTITNCCYYYDYDLVLRLSEVTEFILLPKILYYWRRHSNQGTIFSNKEIIKRQKAIIINKARKRRNLS